MKMIDFIKQKGLLDEFKEFKRIESNKYLVDWQHKNKDKVTIYNKNRRETHAENNRAHSLKYYHKNKILKKQFTI